MVKISIKKDKKTKTKPRQKQKQKQSQKVIVNIGSNVVKARRPTTQALQKNAACAQGLCKICDLSWYKLYSLHVYT